MAKKNPRGAPIRKTAEQILRESQEYFGEQKSVDPTELYDYRLHKRNDFEDSIRRVPGYTAVWINYAKWEGSQNEFDRARSMWELALEEDCRNHTLWCKYAEFEMLNKFINHARNVWDRAVAVLPHVDQLWYKYIRMEEIAGNVAAARLVFDRWMHWTPDQQAWLSYIKFELRYEQVELARQVFERLVQCHPNVVSSWIKYAKFEMRRGEIDRARNVYERALEKKLADGDGDDDEGAEQLFVAFAEFEERYKESESEALRKEFGDWVLIEDAIVGKGKAPKDKVICVGKS